MIIRWLYAFNCTHDLIGIDFVSFLAHALKEESIKSSWHCDSVNILIREKQLDSLKITKKSIFDLYLRLCEKSCKPSNCSGLFL